MGSIRNLYKAFLFSYVGVYVDVCEEVRDFFRAVLKGRKPAWSSGVALFFVLVALTAATVAVATDANEPVVLSDDIRDRIITITSAGGVVLDPAALVAGPTGNPNNQSGMGDGSNPSGGANDNNQSGNTGVDNPNNSGN